MLINYLVQLNAFYRRLEAVPLTAKEISLWHALMMCANQAGWPEWISTPIQVLCYKSGLSADTVYRARKALTEKGYLEVKNGVTSSHCASYKLINLEVIYQNYLQTSLQTSSQGANIYKQNKKKQKKTKDEPQTTSYDIDLLDKFWDTVPKLE